MSEIITSFLIVAGTFALLLGIPLALLIGFNAFDRWHQRKAWRDANDYAHRYMREMHGVERQPDGSWKKLR